MIKYSFNYIYKLFIEAARDIPKWAPDWIQSHEKFHGYESLEDIPKNFPIKYYRDALPVDDNLVTKLNETIENRRRKEINNFINQISSAIYPIFRKMSRSVTGDNESNEIIERLKSNIMEIEKKIDLYKKDLKLGEEVAAILTKHKDYSSISSEDMEKMFDFYAFNENKPLEENLKDAKIGISNYTNAIARIEVMLNFKKNRLVEEQEKLNKVSEEIKINRNNFYEFLDKLYKYLSYADDGIANLIYDQYIENINKNIFKMSKCFVIFKDMSINFKVNTKVGLQNQKINLPPGTSLITVCEKIAEIPEKYFSDLYDKDNKNMFSEELITNSDVETLKTISNSRLTKEAFDYLSTQSIEDAKSVNGTDAKFEIVFSAKASDVLTMSTRSVWTSCQNWLNPDNSDYSYKAVNSAISKYVAIIYATNNKDFRKRGEQMLARSVVLLLQNERTNKPAIFLERAYGEFGGSKYFYDKFKQSLKDHFAGTGIEILEDRPSGDYFFPLESSGQPYFDTWMRTEKAD